MSLAMAFSSRLHCDQLRARRRVHAVVDSETAGHVGYVGRRARQRNVGFTVANAALIGLLLRLDGRVVGSFEVGWGDGAQGAAQA